MVIAVLLLRQATGIRQQGNTPVERAEQFSRARFWMFATACWFTFS